MQKIFSDTRELDTECRTRFFLTEEVMMENAAASMELFIRRKCTELNLDKTVYVLCGPGNNGADGYALARRLSGDFLVCAVVFAEPKTDLCVLQKGRAQKAGVKFLDLSDTDFTNVSGIVADCIFGAGFHGELDESILDVFAKIENSSALKIACDVPSGMKFVSDFTITMGARKLCLYTDEAKDVTGKILVANLGVASEKFEACGNACAFELDETDMILPFRKKQNVHKGKFGHVVCVSGEKCGAAVIASCSALGFGAGLVTLVDKTGNVCSGKKLPVIDGIDSSFYEIMCAKNFPEGMKALALGMGLGRDNPDVSKYFEFLKTHSEVACVLDADAFYYDEISAVLEARNSSAFRTVITPHPKEFSELLKRCGLGNYSTDEVCKNKFGLASKFSKAFPETVLVLKGACTVIAVNGKIYLSRRGCSALSKAGSGDVLAGVILSLLAQEYLSLDAAVTGVLAHGIAAEKYAAENNDYSLTPFKLIASLAHI